MTWFEEYVKPSVEWERKAEQAVLSDDEVKTITEYRKKYNNRIFTCRLRTEIILLNIR
ncbi:hypothetical protein [Staphylococcus aureus]|uniref:hypothetical protein n=1 Tax=Staphylococcus aureus TaxID=1280 RepID=UPI00025F4AB8|nr:hypothetical protein [Staphylococcus aureus]EIK18843.1 hypothetical protein MQO_02777 [Staphylococcus aureus subsp. aureus VRS8]